MLNTRAVSDRRKDDNRLSRIARVTRNVLILFPFLMTLPSLDFYLFSDDKKSLSPFHKLLEDPGEIKNQNSPKTIHLDSANW